MTTRTPTSLATLVLCAALLVGCGDDEPDLEPNDEPTSASVTPSEDETEATDDTEETDSTEDVEPTTPGQTDDADDQTPAGAEELCAAFTDAFAAFAATGAQDFPQGDDPVPAGLRDALQDWGQDLADAGLPDDLTDEQAAGIAVMSRLLLAIPDDATGRDLEALEEGLSANEDRQVEAAGDYVEQTCDSSFF